MTLLEVVVLVGLAVLNLAAFAAFGIDKRKARLERRRISEATLIGLAFAGGLLGAWVAMKVFRHKTQKRSFQLKMVLVSIFNLAWLLFWLLWK